MRKFILLGLLLFTACSSTDTVLINSETELNKDSKVDWAITTQDSILDFRKGVNRFVEIKGDTLVYIYSEDSKKAYQVSEFRAIHTFQEAPISIMILSSIVVSLVIFGFLLPPINVGG
jgi:hypothetical protein